MPAYDPAMRASWEARRRARAAIAAAALAVAFLLTACGGAGDGHRAAEERAADSEVLNVGIGQEMTLVDAYRAGLPLLRRAGTRRLFRRLIAQEREHLDGLTKAMRGLGGRVDAEAEEVDVAGSRSEGRFLLLAYELTASQLTHFLDDVTHLDTRAPQSFAASIAASQAQHLVAIRRLLGADPVESVPEAFDTGEVPPPGRLPGGRGG
jgi:rubrerythrin